MNITDKVKILETKKKLLKLAKYEDLEEKCGYDIAEAIQGLSGEILRLKDEPQHLKRKKELINTTNDSLVNIAESTSDKNICTHKDDKGNHTIEYDSAYEMRSSDMHCEKCGKSGSWSELTERAGK